MEGPRKESRKRSPPESHLGVCVQQRSAWRVVRPEWRQARLRQRHKVARSGTQVRPPQAEQPLLSWAVLAGHVHRAWCRQGAARVPPLVARAHGEGARLAQAAARQAGTWLGLGLELGLERVGVGIGVRVGVGVRVRVRVRARVKVGVGVRIRDRVRVGGQD